MLLTSLVQNRVDGAVEELRHHGHTALEGDDVLRLCCGRHVGCWVVSSAVRALASSLAGKMLALLAACERKRSRLYVRTLRHKKGRPRSPGGGGDLLSMPHRRHAHCSPRCSPERCTLPGPLPPRPARGSSRPSSRPSMSSLGEFLGSNRCRIAVVSSVGTSGYLSAVQFLFGRRFPAIGGLA